MSDVDDKVVDSVEGASEESEAPSVCSTCDGSGRVESGPICNRPPSDCCGGCFTDVPCPDCGQADDEPDFPDDEDPIDDDELYRDELFLYED